MREEKSLPPSHVKHSNLMFMLFIAFPHIICELALRRKGGSAARNSGDGRYAGPLVQWDDVYGEDRPETAVPEQLF